MKKYFLVVVIHIAVFTGALAQTKILFLGNSFTKYAYSTPSLFAGMATAAGIPVTIDYRTQGGMAVATEQGIPGHWVDATSQTKINAQNWDYIVIQDNQGNYAGSFGSIPSWAMGANTTVFGQIKANNSCTRIIYFAGWGPSGGTSSGDNTTACINRIHNNVIYLNNAIADEIVCPIHKAWITSMTQLPSVNLYYSDNLHPSLEAVYLNTATLFTTIFKMDLTNVNYTGGINASTAQAMRTIAYNTVTNSTIYPASHLNAFTPTITVNGASLICNGTYSNYQWYNNGSPVGTNSNIYIATSNGMHKVVVTDSIGCFRSSFQVNLTTVDIASNQETQDKIKMNSLTNNVFELVSDMEGLISVYDSQGKLISTENKNSNKTTIDLSQKSKGLYLITLINEGQRTYQKVNVH